MIGNVNTDVRSVAYLNPDVNNKPSPVVITLYQLKDKTAFETNSYDALVDHDAELLGSSLLDKKQLEVRPEEFTKIPAWLMSPQTHFVGVIAGYRNISDAVWRTSIPVESYRRDLNLLLQLQSQGVDLTRQ